MQNVELKKIAEADIPFLFQVYAETRLQELTQTDWSDSQKHNFLAMQFLMQHTQYMQNYTAGEFYIIQHQGQQIGRLYIQKSSQEIRIIDIAILEKFRGFGIGTQIMQDLLQQAANAKLPLTLHVEKMNPALAWYQRLGLEIVDDKEVYYFLSTKINNPKTH